MLQAFLQADLEELDAVGEGRRGGKRPARALELEARKQRHTQHIARVEQVLRLLENDQVHPRSSRVSALALQCLSNGKSVGSRSCGCLEMTSALRTLARHFAGLIMLQLYTAHC